MDIMSTDSSPKACQANGHRGANEQGPPNNISIIRIAGGQFRFSKPYYTVVIHHYYSDHSYFYNGVLP